MRKNKKMKNAKNIQKITTSLFLAATLVLGSVSFAVPGIMPSAFAAKISACCYFLNIFCVFHFLIFSHVQIEYISIMNMLSL